MMAPTDITANSDATISVIVMSCMSGTLVSPCRVPKKCNASLLLYRGGGRINDRREGWLGTLYGLLRSLDEFG